MSVLIGLILGGLALLMAEIFLPGMVAGILGLCLWLGAVLYAAGTYGADVALWVFLGELVGGVLFFFFWPKVFPHSKLSRGFRLGKVEVQHSAEPQENLLGKRGQAVSLLRPTGVALIEGKRVDVVSEGLPIEAGRNIEVVQVEGVRVVVRAV
jgi:membrane-bound serine protease (ClpP class)